MSTLTREEAEQWVAAFCQSSQPAHGYRRNQLHLTPKPHVELYNEAIELLRAKLHEYPKNKVHPYEFLKAVEGKEEFVGMPIIWAEWPTKEQV